jgi:nicotinate dehydrogenase subunit B
MLPKIEAILVENPAIPPQGGGEPAITCMGGVLANAVFDATGARVFELPMTPERIKTALAGSQDSKPI